MSLLGNPDPLCLEGNLAENWRSWSAGFDLFLTASGIDEKDEAVPQKGKERLERSTNKTCA